MRVALLLDKVLRVCAMVSAIAAAPMVLLLGIFATDSGTPAATIIGLAIIGLGWSLLLAVIVLSLRFRKPPPAIGGQSAFWTGVVYFFGAGGLVFGSSQILYQIHTNEKYQEVASGNPNYPITNPQAVWDIQIVGALADSVPLEFIEAKYIVGDGAIGQPEDAACRTDSAHGDFPLMHTEQIPVVRSGGKYQVLVLADKYLPGRCGWHLRNVDFKVQQSEIVPAWVYAYVDHNAINGPSTSVAKSTRIDLWCESRMSWRVTRSVICKTLTNLSADVAKKIPDGRRSESFELAAYPESGPREVNFYDLAAANGGG